MGGGGGGGGGYRGAVRFGPNTKSGFGIGSTLFKYVFTHYNFGRGA